VGEVAVSEGNAKATVTHGDITLRIAVRDTSIGIAGDN
jgi:hypothetical protein